VLGRSLRCAAENLFRRAILALRRQGGVTRPLSHSQLAWTEPAHPARYRARARREHAVGQGRLVVVRTHRHHDCCDDGAQWSQWLRRSAPSAPAHLASRLDRPRCVVFPPCERRQQRRVTLASFLRTRHKPGVRMLHKPATHQCRAQWRRACRQRRFVMPANRGRPCGRAPGAIPFPWRIRVPGPRRGASKATKRVPGPSPPAPRTRARSRPDSAPDLRSVTQFFSLGDTCKGEPALSGPSRPPSSQPQPAMPGILTTIAAPAAFPHPAVQPEIPSSPRPCPACAPHRLPSPRHYHGALTNGCAAARVTTASSSWPTARAHHAQRGSRLPRAQRLTTWVIDWIGPPASTPNLCTIFILPLPEHAERFTLLAMGTHPACAWSGIAADLHK